MKRNTGWIALILAAVGVLALLSSRGKAWEPEYDVSYPMVNQNITWEGAGYNGICGRNQE